MKKILSTILCLAMLASLLIPAASAASPSWEGADAPTISRKASEVKDDQFTVSFVTSL